MSHSDDDGGGDATPSAVAILEPSKACLSRFGYHYVRELGKGSFGNVVLVRDQAGSPWAMKLVVPERVSFGESEIWETVRHPNILNLAEIIALPEVPATAFKMPAMDRSLEEVIECPDFRSSPSALQSTIKYCREIVGGLSYLHETGLVHMDLKTNNVLISTDGRAVICDFTFLNIATQPVTSYGIPFHLRPPEACPSKGENIPVDGPAFEAWTFGLLALDAFTRHLTWMLPGMPETWPLEVYPVLYKYIQEDRFRFRVVHSFQGTDLDEDMVATIRNFVIMFLALRPEDRPTMIQAVDHRLFKADGYWAREDTLWAAKNEKASPDVSERHPTNQNRTYVTRPVISANNRTIVISRPTIAINNGTYVVPGPDITINNRTYISSRPILAINNITYVTSRPNIPINNRTYVTSRPTMTISSRTYITTESSEDISTTCATSKPKTENNKTYAIAPVIPDSGVNAVASNVSSKPGENDDPLPADSYTEDEDSCWTLALKPNPALDLTQIPMTPTREPDPQIPAIYGNYRDREDKEPLLGKKKGGLRRALRWMRKKMQKLKIG